MQVFKEVTDASTFNETFAFLNNYFCFTFHFQGGTKNGTDLIEMAKRIHHQNLAPRITAPDVDERKHEIGSTSRRQCLLN